MTLKYIHHYKSPLGMMMMASDGEVLTGLWFEGQKYFPSFSKDEIKTKKLPIFDKTEKWLDIYFSGKEPDFRPNFLIEVTEFQRAVLEVVLSIPYGKTMTYGNIAKKVASRNGKMSAQAVGGAVGQNPLLLIIPCHRVIGANGILTGYAAGVDKKVKLLTLENWLYS